MECSSVHRICFGWQSYDIKTKKQAESITCSKKSFIKGINFCSIFQDAVYINI